GEGKFDWVIVNPDCTRVYKLAGATANNTFSYDIDGDGKADRLNLLCDFTSDEQGRDAIIFYPY
ncbi:MAG: hypothetical protein GXO19_01250, partial [Epsilonproteobacteria bacterium]|nr:hypothetical protein [Campylobacterota bacterium]NPA56340.1 hypothetical protein [Campylobacterota bacterium]